MLKNIKISKAVALALTGTALALGGVSIANATVNTMYNLSTADGVDNSTNTTDPAAGGVWALWKYMVDGWANGANSTDGSAVGTVAPQKWAGTGSLYATPFGYTGAHLNWGFEITGGNGGTGVISTYDSFARYGVYADIDTAQGAWSATNTGSVYGGRRHDLDVGLFRSDVTGTVTLTATGIIYPANNFGFTIFQGMDTVTDYLHYGNWNNNNNAFAPPYNSNSVFGGANAGTPLNAGQIVAASVGAIAAYGNSAQNINTITFNATAGQIYTIAIGGYRNGTWADTLDGYSLTISQVPIPAAVWLFGSALTLIGVFGRNQRRNLKD